MLEEAGRLAPHDPDIMMNLGRLYGLRYDYPLADKYFKAAIRLASWRMQSFLDAGAICIQLNRFEMAERYLRRAVEQNGSSVEALVLLAGACERQRRLEEALQLVERALSVDGSYPMALLSQARLKRMLGQLEEAEKSLHRFFAKPGADDWTRALGWYELGGVLDRQGRYDEAMTALLQAKTLLRPAATEILAKTKPGQGQLAQMEKDLSAVMLQQWFEMGPQLQPQRPLSFLCGHPRSGTTLLDQVLDSHPGIISAEETLIFEDNALQPLTRSYPVDAPLLRVLESVPIPLLLRSRREYFDFMERFLGQGIGDRMLLDKNPALNPRIPAIIHIFPEARFLVAIRDPRDVCLSCFMQPLPVNPVSAAYLNLEDTAAQYASVMGFWKAVQPLMKNPSLEVRYEDMVDNLEFLSRRVLDFLGVTWDDRVLHFTEHAKNRAVRSPTYADVSKPVFKTAVGRWRNYQKYLEPCLEKLKPFLRAFGYE